MESSGKFNGNGAVNVDDESSVNQDEKILIKRQKDNLSLSSQKVISKNKKTEMKEIEKKNHDTDNS